MYLSSAKVETVFEKVKQVKQNKKLLCLSPDHVPVSIEDLQYVIEDQYGWKISKYEVSFSADFLRGMVEKFNNGTANVYVGANQSIAAQRFTAAKELAHIMIDEEEDWSPRGQATIDNLIVEEYVPSEPPRKAADGNIQSEALAEIAAMEILYPIEFREDDQKRVKSGEATIPQISIHFNLPEFIVGKALNPSYANIAHQMWDRIGWPDRV